jgi:hypothetical protein
MVLEITSLLGQRPVLPEPSLNWIPPPFNEVETYTFEMCMQGREIVDFSIFNNKMIRISVSGVVRCWGDDDADLQGQGHMEIKLGPNVTKTIDVVVLGYIVITGSAICWIRRHNSGCIKPPMPWIHILKE